MKDEKNKIIDEKEETVKIEQSVDGNEELENKMKEKDKNSEEKFEESNLDNIESTENKDENTKEEVAEIRCKKCGAVLEKTQKFCPHCGEQNGDVVVEEKNKHRKGNIKKKLVLTFGVIIIVVIIAGVTGKMIYSNYEKKADDVTRYLRQYQYSDAISKYEDLGNLGKKLFREDIVYQFIDMVKNNKYQAGSSDEIVNAADIGKYEQFKKVADTLQIKSEDNTNVIEYIDAVLKLKEYEQYNEILKCVLACKDELMDSFQSVQDSTSSYYLVDYYIGQARNSADDAYEKALKYDATKYNVSEFIDSIKNYSDALDEIYYGDLSYATETSVYKGYKQDKIEMRGDRAEMSDFPLYLNTVAGGLDRRDQTIGGFSFVVKIYTVPVVEIIG